LTWIALLNSAISKPTMDLLAFIAKLIDTTTRGGGVFNPRRAGADHTAVALSIDPLGAPNGAANQYC
jgi:hypothetical protein